MSKHSAKIPVQQMKKSPYVFASQDGDEDDDEDDDDIVMTGRKGGMDTKMPSKDLNLSQKSNSSTKKGLHNSMERDSFLNAFLDRDANLSHGKITDFIISAKHFGFLSYIHCSNETINKITF